MESVNKGFVTFNNLVKFHHVSDYFWFKVIYYDLCIIYIDCKLIFKIYFAF